ncbi:MAG: hypothetical protein J0G36_17375 [Afipia sp.]|nr:hypothetical protein [Afipia sp.]
MKLLYIGSHHCPADTLSRLFLLGDEIAFLDRPSVTFGSWGTIGRDSGLRKFSFDGLPVKIEVMAPPSGPARELYEPYVEADLRNPQFIRVTFDGIRNDSVFAGRLIHPAANYGSGVTGSDLLREILADASLADRQYDLKSEDPGLMYRPDLLEGRKAIFRHLLVEASIEVTSGIVMAEELDAIPVADDQTYPKLLSLRTSSSHYLGGTHVLAPYLGMRFTRSVIPDEILAKISFSGIFDYRRKTKDLYDAWNIEVNKAAAKISEADLTNPNEAVQRIIASELAPKLKEYENEMSSARDVMFGDMIKGLAVWQVPTLSLSYIAQMGYFGALANFASAVRATVPSVVDYVKAKRSTKRKHAVSYLVGVTKR